MGGGADVDGDIGAMLGCEEGTSLEWPVDRIVGFGSCPALVGGGEQPGARAPSSSASDAARSPMPTGSSSRPRSWLRRLTACRFNSSRAPRATPSEPPPMLGEHDKQWQAP